MNNLPFLTEFHREAPPGIAFKSQPEDFVVEEIPLYEPVGSGTHSYFWIEKRGITTHEAARRLARALGKRDRDAGLAGLKDAQAVTRQWISFEHVAGEKAQGLDLGPELQVLNTRRHGNKLKMGHLRGNRFVVRLRSEQTSKLVSLARQTFLELNRLGIPNYFGPQRFGRELANAALGKLLAQGNEPGYLKAAAAAGLDARRANDRRIRNLMVNALQAELFNRVLTRRMPEIGKLLSGDLAWLHRNGAVFKVEDAAKEQPRADAFEISPSGPLFGPKMALPEGEPGAFERAVLAESGVSAEDFGRREAERQPGARRPLRVAFLEPPEVQEKPEGVVLRFALPSGSYATVVLREIVGDEPTAVIPHS